MVFVLAGLLAYFYSPPSHLDDSGNVGEYLNEVYSYGDSTGFKPVSHFNPAAREPITAQRKEDSIRQKKKSVEL